jgi:hypothetical protein
LFKFYNFLEDLTGKLKSSSLYDCSFYDYISGGSQRWGIGQKGEEYISTIKSLVKLDISFLGVEKKL